MLEVMGLVKRYGDVLALDGCSVNVPSGHISEAWHGESARPQPTQR